MTLFVIFNPYHFVRTILSMPFCPIPFCLYTILSVPFCPLPFCPKTVSSGMGPLSLNVWKFPLLYLVLTLCFLFFVCLLCIFLFVGLCSRVAVCWLVLLVFKLNEYTWIHTFCNVVVITYLSRKCRRWSTGHLSLITRTPGKDRSFASTGISRGLRIDGFLMHDMILWSAAAVL